MAKKGQGSREKVGAEVGEGGGWPYNPRPEVARRTPSDQALPEASTAAQVGTSGVGVGTAGLVHRWAPAGFRVGGRPGGGLPSCEIGLYFGEESRARGTFRRNGPGTPPPTTLAGLPRCS